ncbi:hypothetical protein C9374_005617 [Naegleria lovaniensis]|uniref:Uncharacterized protein n=1 Tax=Naegleria lovaniensis TaxID=51637 RepID=A0AA88KK91_NAELO|nr:uncharacterized protein C9374_005617 [Naegleria lovaniensis]KAG2382415.1 hypothetical protein C9374_005617 [Naegleria lovaniensis]
MSPSLVRNDIPNENIVYWHGQHAKFFESGINQEFIQILSRRGIVYAITSPDHKLYWKWEQGHSNQWSDDVFSNYKENRNGEEIGLERAYFVAASYHHVLILTDKIVDGIVSPDIGSSNFAFTELPNGERFKVPKRPSVVAIHVGSYDNPPFFGEDVINLQTLVEGTSSVKQGQIYWLRDVEKALAFNEYITYMACAAYTSVFVTSNGRLLVGGSNQFGEVGQSIATTPATLRIEEHPFSRRNPNVKICKVACGDHSIIALSTEGKIYVCGYNGSNELMLDSNRDIVEELCESKRVNEITDHDPAIDVATQYYHFLFLTKSGRIYMNGSDHNTTRTFTLPFSHDGTVFHKVACVGATNYQFHACLINSQSDVCLVDISIQDQTKVIFMKKAVHIDSNKILWINGGEENRSPLCVYLKTQHVSGSSLQTKLANHLTNVYGEDGVDDILFRWM